AGPVVAGHAGLAERPPATLNVPADGAGRPAVARHRQQPTHAGAVHVEHRQQLPGGGGAEAGPLQWAGRVVVAVVVRRRVQTMRIGELPDSRTEGEVTAE